MSATSANTSIVQATATVDHRRRTSTLTWVLWIMVILTASGLLALAMIRFSPNWSYIAWLIFICGAVAILYQPRYGIYLTLFLLLLGDKNLMPYYPFQLDFSSPESWMFVNHQVIFSPLEVYLVLTLVAWFVRDGILHRLHFYWAELFSPMLIFMAFVVFGLVYGLGRGGNVNVGLWEVRSIFYLPIMLVLVSNLFTKRDHVNIMMSMVVIALFIEGLVGISFYFTTFKANPGMDPALIMEHTAAIQMNSLFVFCLALWMYRGSLKARLLTLFLAMPVLFTFIMIQRRAAFLALLFALICMAFVLYRENRSAFRVVVPAVILVFSLYLILFWNNSGSLGFAARAIKSQFAPQQVSLRDQQSDQYRRIENYDIYYTIRQAPLTGVGFGKMFSMVVPLPDISFFVWYQYITHNSIGWIWMKTGIGGFIAMLFLIGLAIMNGLRVLFRIPDRTMRAVVLTAVLYIIMHFIYAYVDMSWDSKSMVYIGAMMGIISYAERVVAGSADPEQIP